MTLRALIERVTLNNCCSTGPQACWLSGLQTTSAHMLLLDTVVIGLPMCIDQEFARMSMVDREL